MLWIKIFNFFEAILEEGFFGQFVYFAKWLRQAEAVGHFLVVVQTEVCQDSFL